MEERKAQNTKLIFALDIGTRSIVGVVGESCEGKLKVLAIESAEHKGRTMIDGQIDNIQQVADLARTVTKRLEERLGITLNNVCVAAAGRALQTQRGSFVMELPAEQVITDEIISRLEAGAVSQAEENLQSDESDWKQMFLVGYTVAQYRLDNYPLTVLRDHKGKRAEVDVVATFLPGEVVESLYAAMHAAGLQITSLTLEPIAAMNAAIPAELRLLNLALVDIGAGTTDIAVCRGGSVVGYTMATIAGDEITETIMRAFLVDFATAETMKRSIKEGKSITYQDILGLEGSVSYEEITAAIREPMERLAQAIAKQVVEVNTAAPSAVFLAGGGSKLNGLREAVADSLEMDEKRVAIAGNNFEKSAFSDKVDLQNPEYTTPLGIAISAGLGLLNDSYVVMLNGEVAKLFRSGAMTVRDVLLMNGYTYQDMIGRTGQNLSLVLDGRRILYRGEPAAPAILTVNGVNASITAPIKAGDRIVFTPAKSGNNAAVTLEKLMKDRHISGRVLVNNQEATPDTPLKNDDVILVLEVKAPEQPEAAPPAAPVEEPVPEVREVESVLPANAPLEILMNGAPLVLAAKADGQPYYLMDLLQYSGIDFDHVERPVRLAVNGRDSSFQQIIMTNDRVDICYVEK